MKSSSILLKTQNKFDHSPQTVFAKYESSFYRVDIQGIRAVSAFLIMIYHIWLGKVSGGVDVFFVISGFLVTTTLLKGLARRGKIEPIKFFSRIFRRILPSAFVVLTTTLVFSLVFIPAPLWKYSITEFIASAAQIENLELIRMGTDYLAREAPPSQFQQFWALSIQMQFYVLLLVLIALLGFASIKTRSVRPLFIGLGTIVALSLFYSIWFTHTDPTEAYFNPFTRIWEFLTGSLIALSYPFLSNLKTVSGKHIWNVLTLTAVFTLSILGLVTGNADFPGWIAIIPVSCAAILIVAGKVFPEGTIVTKALSNRTLVYFGSFSFLIYLWHWPVLVFAHHHFGHTNLNFFEGVSVIIIAILLAAGTKKTVEDPLNRLPIKQPGKQFMVYVSLILVFAMVGTGLRQGVAYLANTSSSSSNNIAQKPLAIQESVDTPLKSFISIDLDRPQGIDCLSSDCSGGDPTANKTLVMVGASHSAQWFDIVNQFGKENGYKVITRFGEAEITNLAKETNADVLFMNSTITTPDNSTEPEEIYLEDREPWEELLRDNIEVVTIRDNPRFSFYQNACVWNNQERAQECAINKNTIFSEHNPVEKFDNDFENFHSIDLTEKFCVDDFCPAVHDNILMYYDKHHISKTYSNYIERDVINELRAAIVEH